MTLWDESGVVGHDSYRTPTSYMYCFELVHVCLMLAALLVRDEIVSSSLKGSMLHH